MSTSTRTSRAVQFVESFGGPAALDLREVPVPEVAAGQVRVSAAGLNPMDWFMTSDADAAARFGLSLPCGFGNDYAGVVDEVGDGARDGNGVRFEVGDRVFGAAAGSRRHHRGRGPARHGRDRGGARARRTRLPADHDRRRRDGVLPANGANAAPGAIEEIARLAAEGLLRVPIAATFPVEEVRAAVELQAGRHVHGKVVVDLP
ncbi:zinc-binding dehydrogenase [Saccharopolyspora sp. 6V]|uniref:zinc-binding dehydrogenase n=1 Tax=Saccharopolyspora sp. 6V TaxID=2877239 RepID=UPI0035A889EE